MLFDLNGFKSYNDRFGHPAGDALLARLGARSSRRACREGQAYRLGGDEFCVLVRVDATDDGRSSSLRRPRASPRRAKGSGSPRRSASSCSPTRPTTRPRL